MKSTARLRSFLLIASSSLVTVSSASAQSNWLNGTTGTQQWDTSTNWSTDPTVPNGTGVVANLSRDLTVAQTVNLATPVSLGALTYGDTIAGFFAQNITGSTLTFNNNGSGATLTQASTSEANPVAPVTTLPGNIANNIVLDDNLAIVHSSTDTSRGDAIQLSGVISGTGGITLNAGGGGGVWFANSGNTYSGGLTLNHSTARVLTFTNADAFGTGTVTINAGTVDTSGDVSPQLLTTSNSNVWNGSWTHAGLWNNNGNVTLGGNITVTQAFTSLGLGGDISETGGPRSLTFAGGTSVLGGTNSYTGGTSVTSGSLAFLKTASMPSTGNVSFSNQTGFGIGLGGSGWTSTGTGAGTLAGIFDGTNVGVGAHGVALSYSSQVALNLIVTGDHSFGAISNLGSGNTVFTKSGIGKLAMTGDNIYTGATTFQGGGGLVLDYGSSDTSKFASAAALTLGGASTFTGVLGGGTITLKGGALTEVVSATTLNQGNTAIARDGGTTAKLRLNAITRAAGGTMSFADATIADTDRPNTHGIIGGYATLGNDWATSASSGDNIAIAALGAYDGALPDNVGDATKNYILSGNLPLTAATAANSIKITDTGASETLTLGAFNLNITSVAAVSNHTQAGGIMYAGGTSGTYTIAGGGTGRLGSSAANQELIFAVQSGTLTVDAIFAGNSAITKTGAGTLVLGGTNTSNGTYFINQGVLRLNNAAASGAAPSVAGGLGTFVQNGAALELTGGFAFTDKERVMMSGTGVSNGGALRSISGINTWRGFVEIAMGGARINNDSSGLFTLNNGITTLAGGDVTFGGTGDITVTARTTDFRFGSGNAINGGGGLIKDGAGILTLSGRNNYSGNTTVSAGTLILADDASLGFTLGNNSGVNNSLTGTGTATLAGDFVINTTAADALTSGSWTLENVSTLTGPYSSTFTVIGFTDAGDDKWTKVNGGKTYTFDEDTGILTLTSGGDVTAPSLTSITDNVSGGPITEDSSVTYTVTFNEDMDSTTVTTADFDNQGTAACTIVSVVETTPTSGVFTVVATPTSAGTLRLRIPTGAVLADMSTNNLVVPVSDDTTITVRSKYEAWSGASDFDVDTNGDGVRNGLAFLLGAADKNVSAVGLLPAVTHSGGNLVLTFNMRNAANRKSASLKVQHSNDLGISDAWADSAVVPDVAGLSPAVNGVTFNVTLGSPTNAVVATVAASEALPGTKLFGRLKATHP